MDFEIGDNVRLDGKVLGTVHGFYEAREEKMVVFEPQWGFSRTCYGYMPLTATGQEDAGNQELKLVSYSLIIVHPSNLTKDE